MQSVSAEFTTHTSQTVRRPVAKVEVCWDGSTWTDETPYLIRHSGELALNRPGEDLVPAGDVGRCTVELHNADGRFSWKRTDGPLYAHIGGGAGLTGKQVRVWQGFQLSGGAEYVRIFTGVIYRWDEDSTQRLVRLYLRDVGFAYLQHKASTALYTNIRVDQWIDILADLAGISAGDRVFDVSHFRIPYAWLDDESILEDMWAAAQADGGRIYFDHSGRLRFESVTHWLTGPHTTSQWTFGGAGADNYETPLPEFSPDDLATEIVVELQGRVAREETVVYSLDVVKTCPPGETMEFDCRLSQPASLIWTPQKDTDYQAIGPGGQDLNDDVSFTVTKYAQRVHVQMTNGHAVLPASLIFFQLRGIPLVGGPTQQVVRDVASPPVDFERVRSVRANQYVQLISQGEALAGFLRDRHKQLLPVWTIHGVPGVPQLELGDRVTFRDPAAVSGSREGFVIRIAWEFAHAFTQSIDILDAENLYPYGDYFVIGQTALGANGRAWH